MSDHITQTIERCIRKFREDRSGMTVFYVGYDQDGNEVAELTGAEFRQWLRDGFVEYLSAGGGES